MAGGEFCQNDASAMRFDDIASTHIVRPIVPLNENVRQDRLDERPRLVLVKDDDSIDGAQSGKDRRAIALRIDRPAGPLIRSTEESLFRPITKASPWARANSRYRTWPRWRMSKQPFEKTSFRPAPSSRSRNFRASAAERIDAIMGIQRSGAEQPGGRLPSAGSTKVPLVRVDRELRQNSSRR